MKIECTISVGELLDKYSILYIKSKIIKDKQKLKNVHKEQIKLQNLVEGLPDHEVFVERLTKVNTKLWHTEDLIRQKESTKNFNEIFIELARNIYKLNDERYKIKQEANQFYNSELIEEKELPDYTK